MLLSCLDGPLTARKDQWREKLLCMSEGPLGGDSSGTNRAAQHPRLRATVACSRAGVLSRRTPGSVLVPSGKGRGPLQAGWWQQRATFDRCSWEHHHSLGNTCPERLEGDLAGDQG